MPRYEFKEGTSSKFWEIELEDESFTVRYGKIGTEGQEQTKDFDSKAEAKKAYEKLIAEKTKKGYVLVSGTPPGGAGAKRNPELESAIDRDPDGVQGYLVYGDWLQANGDPRGELVAIQARLAELPRAAAPEAAAGGRRRRGSRGMAGGLEFPGAPPGADPALLASQKKLLAEHREHFLGDLAELFEDGDDEGIRVEWHCGFIRSLRLSLTYDQYDAQEADFESLLVGILKHPSCRFLQHLAIGMFDYEGENHYPAIIKKLAKADIPPTLRTLHVGDFEFPDENEISWVNVGDVSPLYSKLPHLETLILQGAEIGLGKAVELPKLKTLVVRTGGLPKAAAKAIAASDLPELETLIVWTGQESYGATSAFADLRPILDGKKLPKLAHLGLMNCEYTDDVAKELPTSRLLPQLRTLDLSLGTLGDEGARALASRPEAFAHLEHVDLDECYLTKEGVALVAKLGKECSAEGQRQPYEWDEQRRRFAAVGE